MKQNLTGYFSGFGDYWTVQPEGESLVCGMLEGWGGGMGIVFLIVDPFRINFVYKAFPSGKV